MSIVLPLACAPLLRESKTVEMAIKLGEKEECRFTLNCEDLRKALDWASERQGKLAEDYEAKTCTPPAQGCFLTTACCEILGLTDDCFELNALRHYRDRVLAAMPGGKDDIGLYYRVAPSILERLPEQQRLPLLLSVYARFILPSAIAARLGCNALAYRLYARMMRELTREFAPEIPQELGWRSCARNPRRMAGGVASGPLSSAKPPLRRNQAEVAPQSRVSLVLNNKKALPRTGFAQDTQERRQASAAGLRVAGGVDHALSSHIIDGFDVRRFATSRDSCTGARRHGVRGLRVLFRLALYFALRARADSGSGSQLTTSPRSKGGIVPSSSLMAAREGALARDFVSGETGRVMPSGGTRSL